MKLRSKELSDKKTLFTMVFLQLLPILLLISSIIAMPQALATSSVITTSSTIMNGALDPAPIIVGVGFAPNANKFDFVVDMGKTNFEYDSIAFITLAPMTVGGKNQAPIASSSSLLNVEIVSNTPSVCTIDFEKIHAVAAGICSLKAFQPGNESYAPAPVITQSVVVLAIPTEKLSETKSIEVATRLGSAMYDPDSIDGGYASVLVAGSGFGELRYNTSTDSICSISEAGVIAGISEGNCLISVLKAASGVFADTTSKQISIKIIGSSNISKEVVASVNIGFFAHSLTFMKINRFQSLDVGLCSIYANEKANLLLGTKAKNGSWVWKLISVTQLDDNGAGQFTVTVILNAGQRVRVLVNDVIQMESDV